MGSFFHSVIFPDSILFPSSALASPEFEGRGGEELGQHLALCLDEAYRNSTALPLPSLGIIPGRQCWVLFVDALVLEWSGSVLDALSLAVRAALQVSVVENLALPCLSISERC